MRCAAGGPPYGSPAADWSDTASAHTARQRNASRYFDIEERAIGEVVLRPVTVLRDAGQGAVPAEKPGFEIAEVAEVIVPSREERNARR